MAITAEQQTQLIEVYVASFNRAPDADGLAYWATQLEGGMELEQIARSFFVQPEAASFYPESLTTAEFVDQVYLNVLNRTADADGKAYWVNELDTGLQDRAKFLLAIINAAKTSTNLDDQAVIANKAEAGEYFAITLGSNDTTLATSMMALVTADPASVDSAIAATNVGEAFALTNSATPDTIIGTSGNDTVTGASGTVANTDLIIDQSTTDNDTANLVLTAAYTPNNITNIENVNLDWDAYGVATYNLTNVKGAKNVTLTSSKVGYLGDATVTNVDGVTLTAGSGTVGALNASGFKTGTVEAGSAKTVTVNGSGTNSNNESITVNVGDTATSVTVGTANGFKAATVNAGKATTIAIDDAGNTTDTMSLTVNANATIANGMDGALTLTAADGNNLTMNAIGASLKVQGDGNVTLNSTGLNAETVTNAKTSGTLTIKTTSTGALDLSKVQATLIELSGIKAGADTVANGANLKYSAAGGAIDVTVTGTSTTDAVSAELTAATTASLAATGVETLTVKAAATQVSGADLTIASLATKGNTVKFTGTNDVAVTNIAAAGETNGKVDASGLTGDLTIGIDTTADDDNFAVLGGTGKLNLTTANITGNQSAQGQDADDTVTANATTTGSMTAILGNGKNTVSATGLTTGTLVVTAGSGVDTVTAGAALTTGVINLNLGDGNNVINLDDAADAGTRVVVTGGGDDVLKLTDSLDSNDDVLTWTGGAGTDTLYLSGAGGSDITSKVTLTDVEVIQTTKDKTATVNAALVSEKNFTIKADGTAAGTTSVFKVMGAADSSVINLSTLNIDQSITSAINSVVIDASANTTTAQTITGTAIADTITGGDKDDVIVAGKGTDVIIGSKGNDSIDLTESTADQVQDVVRILAADNGKDTITGFKVGTDDLSFAAASTTIATVAGAAVHDTISVALLSSAGAFALGAGAGTKTSSTADVLELTTTLSSNGDLDLAVNGTELFKALGSTSTSAATQLTVATAADKFYLVAYQDSNAYVYYANAGAVTSDTAVTADEIQLVGVLNGITAGTLDAGDFAKY